MAFKPLAVALGDGDTDIVEMGGQLNGAVRGMVSNVSGQSRTYTLKVYDSGEDETTTIVDGASVDANSSVPIQAAISLASGDKLIGMCSSDGDIVVSGTLHDSDLAPGPTTTAAFEMTFSTATANESPGAGNWRADDEDFGSATELYISESAVSGSDIASWLGQLKQGDELHFVRMRNQGIEARWRIDDAPVDEGDYYRIPVELIATNGLFDDTNNFAMAAYIIGPAGADGVDPGLLYSFDDGVSSGPNAGDVRADNADLSAADNLYFADEDRSGNDHAALLATVGGSSSTVKGYVTLKRASDGVQTVFEITGGATDESGYVTVPVDYISGATSFSDDDALSAEFVRTGDAGDGDVDSVNEVSPVGGDVSLDSDDIPNASGVSGSSTSDALDNLASDLASHGHDADEIALSPTVAGESDVQATLEAIAAGITGHSRVVGYVVIDGPQSFSDVGGASARLVAGSTIAVTPRDEHSRFKLTAVIVAGSSGDSVGVRFRRDGSVDLGIGEARGDRVRVHQSAPHPDGANAHTNIAMLMLDEPETTSEITYEINVVNVQNSDQDLFVNRTTVDTDAESHISALSTFVVEEIFGEAD